MKKMMMAFALVLSVHVGICQASISIMSGYQFPFAKTLLGSSFNQVNIDTIWQNNYLYGSSELKGSLGSGISSTIMISHILTQNLSFDLGINYLESRKYISKFDVGSFSIKETVQAKNYLIVTPSISYYHQTKSKLIPYGRFGLSIPILGHVSLKREGYFPNFYNINLAYDWKYYTRFNVGLSTNLGLKYVLKNNIHLIAELNANGMTMSFSKARLMSYTSNDVDQLSTLTVNEKEIEFVNNYQSNSSTLSNPNEPLKAISYSQSFSSVGLSVGLNFKL